MGHPPPEVEARLAEPSEIPRGAGVIQRAAQASGWTVVATYARGTRPGRTWRVIESLGLRMWLPPHRAVAVWEDGKFTFAATWSWCGTGNPLRKVNASQLKDHLLLRGESQ